MLRGSFAKMMRQRSLLIDLLKIIGSHLIVLHHLVLYAPMAKILEVQLPQLINFLFSTVGCLYQSSWLRAAIFART